MQTRKLSASYLFFRLPILSAIFIFCSHLTCFASDQTRWVEPIFGPEFTFAFWDQNNNEMKSADLSNFSDYIKHLDKKLVKSPLAADRFTRRAKSPTDKHSYVYYTSPHNWFFLVTRDQGVIEINMSPQTYRFNFLHQAEMQKAIFEMAYELSLYPALFLGGGHINLDTEIFLKDPMLFRNFFVDFCNHSELAMGILGYDTNNALPYALNPPEKKKLIKNAIQDFDREYAKNKKSNRATTEYLSAALTRAFNTNYSDKFDWTNEPDDSRFSKYHALSMYHFVGGRIEIRSVRPQFSFDVYLRQTRLLRNRLKYLKDLKGPIPFKSKVAATLNRPGRDDRFDPPINAQKALKSFYQYVTESGEQWQNHRDYLWPEWVSPAGRDIETSELYRFEHSDWFLQQESKSEKQRGCKQILKIAVTNE